MFKRVWPSILVLAAVASARPEGPGEDAPASPAAPTAAEVGDFTQFYRKAPLIWRPEEIPNWAEYRIACSTKLEKGGRFTVATNKDGSHALVLWTKGRVKDVPSGIGSTQDWGFVWDRNGDGRVDYFVFLDGSHPVETPEIRDQIPRPNASGGYAASQEFVLLLLENMRLAFHHHADDNFDGKGDALISHVDDPERPGWLFQFAVLRSTSFSQTVDEDWTFTTEIDARLGPVPRTPDGRFMKLGGVVAVERHLEASSALLEWVNDAVRKCAPPKEALPRG